GTIDRSRRHHWEITLPLPRAAASLSSRLISSEPETLGAAITRKHTPIAMTQTAGLARKRFLVVEAGPLIPLHIAARLEGAGANVVGRSGTGEEALALIEGTRLDAAVLDASDLASA